MRLSWGRSFLRLNFEVHQPLLIRFLTWFAALASAGMFLSIVLAIAGIGPTLMGGEHVPREQWLRVAAPLVAVTGILMALIAWGLARQRRWSRHLVIAMFALIACYAVAIRITNEIPERMMWRAMINAAVFGSVSTWYFYFKPNVAAYFRQLTGR